jgi:hypothetical protein
VERRRTAARSNKIGAPEDAGLHQGKDERGHR